MSDCQKCNRGACAVNAKAKGGWMGKEETRVRKERKNKGKKGRVREDKGGKDGEMMVEEAMSMAIRRWMMLMMRTRMLR